MLKFKPVNSSSYSMIKGEELICVDDSGISKLTKGKYYAFHSWESANGINAVDDSGCLRPFIYTRFRKASDLCSLGEYEKRHAELKTMIRLSREIREMEKELSI